MSNDNTVRTEFEFVADRQGMRAVERELDNAVDAVGDVQRATEKAFGSQARRDLRQFAGTIPDATDEMRELRGELVKTAEAAEQLGRTNARPRTGGGDQLGAVGAGEAGLSALGGLTGVGALGTAGELAGLAEDLPRLKEAALAAKGGIGQLATSLGAGGPLLVGLAALAAGIAFVVKSINDSVADARAAAENAIAARRSVTDLIAAGATEQQLQERIALNERTIAANQALLEVEEEVRKKAEETGSSLEQVAADLFGINDLNEESLQLARERTTALVRENEEIQNVIDGTGKLGSRLNDFILPSEDAGEAVQEAARDFQSAGQSIQQSARETRNIVEQEAERTRTSASGLRGGISAGISLPGLRGRLGRGVGLAASGAAQQASEAAQAVQRFQQEAFQRGQELIFDLGNAAVDAFRAAEDAAISFDREVADIRRNFKRESEEAALGRDFLQLFRLRERKQDDIEDAELRLAREREDIVRNQARAEMDIRRNFQQQELQAQQQHYQNLLQLQNQFMQASASQFGQGRGTGRPRDISSQFGDVARQFLLIRQVIS